MPVRAYLVEAVSSDSEDQAQGNATAATLFGEGVCRVCLDTEADEEVDVVTHRPPPSHLVPQMGLIYKGHTGAVSAERARRLLVARPLPHAASPLLEAWLPTQGHMWTKDTARVFYRGVHPSLTGRDVAWMFDREYRSVLHVSPCLDSRDQSLGCGWVMFDREERAVSLLSKKATGKGGPAMYGKKPYLSKYVPDSERIP
ncbi:hypothetical protein KIPB_012970, partial [Kipferlia bialata]|eukprot:g12970.t1